MNNPPSTRVSLLLRLQSSEDAEAWEQFSELYRPFIYRMARTRGLQDADAHDLAQEVLVRVANSVHKWDTDREKGTFRGWLSRIARNVVVDFLRSNSRKIQAAEFVHDVAQCPESELYDLELRKQQFAWASDSVKGSFREATWQAFWLTAVEQQSVAATAKATGLSVGAVYIARSRVMAKLRQVVQQTAEANHE